MTAETAAGADFETRLALVCEDAPERQGVIKAALDQIGFAMLSVRNSDEAIERLRRDVYEIVLVDEQYQGASPLDSHDKDEAKEPPPPRGSSGARGGIEGAVVSSEGSLSEAEARATTWSSIAPSARSSRRPASADQRLRPKNFDAAGAAAAVASTFGGIGALRFRVIESS